MSIFSRIRSLVTRKRPARRGKGSPKLTSDGKPSDGISPRVGRPRHQRSTKSAPPPPPRRKGFFRLLMGFLAQAGFPLLIVFLLILAYFFYDLPSIDRLQEVKKSPSILVKASNDVIVGSYGDVYGEYLDYKHLPKSLVDAVLATEDRNFFLHFGIDPMGIARAMFVNVTTGSVRQGGSTITQQVAKNVFLTPERTLKRKVQEVVLAFWLESRFSKEEILSIYLNRVYLGAGTYGVDAASQRYFNHSAKELTVSEAAILAGMLKAPSRYSPSSDPVKAKARAGQVLSSMKDAGYLMEKDLAVARKELAQIFTKSKPSGAGTLYFTDWVVEHVPDYVGSVDEDLVVVSTMDPKMQALAEKYLAEIIKNDGPKVHATQGALVSMTPDGAVRAMVGGVSYLESQYNRAVQAERQPGSSFKLFVYLAALEAGLRPDSMVEDKPVTIGNWQPKNYTGRYEGVMTLANALAQSINSVAAQLINYVGPYKVKEMAERLGISSHIDPYLSLALGTNEVTLLDITGAFAHLASHGMPVFTHGIEEIRTKADGRVLYKRRGSGGAPLLDAATVEYMNYMLTGVVEYGTGRGAAIGRPAGGKTGTTQDYKDAWFIGFVPQLVTGVWVGNDDSTSMIKVTGGNLPAIIWRSYMRDALAGQPVQSIPVRAQAGFFDSTPMFGGQPSPNLTGPNQPMQLMPTNPVNGPPPPEKKTPSFLDVILNPIRQEPVTDRDAGEVQYEYPNSRRR